MNWWDDEVRSTLIAYAAIAGPALVVFVAFRPRPLLPMQRLRFGSEENTLALFELHHERLLAAGLLQHAAEHAGHLRRSRLQTAVFK